MAHARAAHSVQRCSCMHRERKGCRPSFSECSARKQAKDDLDDIFAAKGKKSAPKVTTRDTVQNPPREAAPNAPTWISGGFLSSWTRSYA